MAKDKPTASVKKSAKKPGKLGMFTFIVVMLFATPFMMPTVTLVLMALIPSYVAFFTDNDPQKSGALSVGVMNIAGTTPFIIDLWTKGQTMSNAFHILGEANSWVVILGAAAIGQLIVYAVPQAIATLTLTTAETRIKALRKNLDMLKETWGPDVASTKPMDKLIQD